MDDHDVWIEEQTPDGGVIVRREACECDACVGAELDLMVKQTLCDMGFVETEELGAKDAPTLSREATRAMLVAGLRDLQSKYQDHRDGVALTSMAHPNGSLLAAELAAEAEEMEAEEPSEPIAGSLAAAGDSLWRLIPDEDGIADLPYGSWRGLDASGNVILQGMGDEFEPFEKALPQVPDVTTVISPYNQRFERVGWVEEALEGDLSAITRDIARGG